MRINLTTKFAEKEAVKALGARWDPIRKNWYIENVEDLTPFMKWLPGIDQKNDSDNHSSNSSKKKFIPNELNSIEKSSDNINSYCGCNVLPWEDCVHTK